MYEMSMVVRVAGADCPTVLLAADLGQRDGISVSNARFTGTAFGGDNVSQLWATGRHSGMTASAGTAIPAAVRVRKPADANVPGAPPRGAPV